MAVNLISWFFLQEQLQILIRIEFTFLFVFPQEQLHILNRIVWPEIGRLAEQKIKRHSEGIM
jgi:hypothetical protein